MEVFKTSVVLREGGPPEKLNEPDTTKAPLFSSVHFHIIERKDFSTSIAKELRTALLENGATEKSPSPTRGKVDLASVTHIISDTIDFEGYEAAEDSLIPVVTPSWVHSSLMKKRLANPRSHSANPRQFFSGLVVCPADLPPGDKDAIIGGVLAMGGLYSSAITKLVTHIVALTMDPPQCQTAVAKSLNCKIVLPHWFDDCLRLGKRIDEGPYILPDPEITRIGNEVRVPDTARPDLQGAMSVQIGRLPTDYLSPAPARENLSVFQDRKIMLSKDLEVQDHLRRTIEHLVRRGGGVVVDSIHQAEVLICQYREGEDYISASLDGKVVGNLPWLYHLVTHNSWTSPLRRLLHYPIARGGLPGFKKFRISLSNYNGEARIYLENLAKAAGCEFTKTMKMDNTHLITAHTFSEKCEAAKEWNINMCNHLWLEESYAKWQIQSLTNPRYTHFPPRTNLTEVVGQTPIDRDALERNFFPRPVEPVDLPRPMQQVDRNVAKVIISNSSAIQPRTSSDDGNPLSEPIPSDGPTPRPLKQTHRSNDGSALRTPVNQRLGPEGKENETPSTSGSRGAKARAAARLHEMAPDIALYEKERKRVGGVIHGGRRKSDAKPFEPSRKRSISPENDADDLTSNEGRPGKRGKKMKTPTPLRLLVTGHREWNENPKAEGEDKARLRDLGITITMEPADCNYVAAPRILRTAKFIRALANAPKILSLDYLQDSLDKNERLDPDDYILQDREGEERYDLQLSEAVARARANDCNLLQGQIIYCSESIVGGFETYKSIIAANGGRCLLYRARAGSITSGKPGGPGSADDDDDESEDPEYVYLISGPTRGEARLWPKFRKMVQSIGKIPRVVKTDWMLDLALRQQIRWIDEYEMTNDDIVADA